MSKLTRGQQNSLHLYCERLAEAFNDAGYDKVAILSAKALPVSWSKEAIKEDLWKEVQKALYGTTSTRDLDKLQVSDVYENLNRFTASKFGISVPFPSEDEL